MKILDSIQNAINKITNDLRAVSDDSKNKYDEILNNYNNLMNNEYSLQEKKDIYGKMLELLSSIDNQDFEIMLKKNSTKDGYGYSTPFGWCVDLSKYTTESLLNQYMRLNEKNDIYIENLNVFNNLIKNTKQHNIVINNNNITKRKLQDMEEIKLTNITKKFNKDSLIKYVVIDLETTGLKAQSDEIIELTAVKVVDGDPIEYFSTLIKPHKKITDEITSINNITNDMVENAPDITEVIKDFDEFVDGFNIVGHNIVFDLKFLFCNGFNFFNQKGIKIYDTLELSKKAFKDLDNYKLDNICENNLQILRTDAHRSLSDSFATYYLFEACIEIITNND